MLEPKPFRAKARLQSFVYAYRGIKLLFKTQHNAWIHLSISALVLAAGILFGISFTEWCLIFLAMGLVLSAEGFNTAIEHLADVVFPGKNNDIGLVKDVAAGAVLLAAIFAALVGLFIFAPKIVLWLDIL